MSQAKPWWKSKTILVNLAVGLLAAAETVTDALGDAVPAEAMGSVLVALSVANIVLRAVTGQPVNIPEAKKANRPEPPK